MIKKIFFIFFSALLALPGIVFALEVHYPFGLNDTSTLPEFARVFFNVGMGGAVLIALCSVGYGGINYLISYGRGKFTDNGIDWIKSGIIGLLIVACAYLITSTINPALVVFKLDDLPNIFSDNPISDYNFNPLGAKIVSYDEIPIGKMTENLLSKTMDCYAFDSTGNPIAGKQIKTDDSKNIVGPTYLDHDRADCLSQLIDGAAKKADLISQLSDKITALMNSCDCSKYGNCQKTCQNDQNNPGCTDPNPECNGTCGGSCIGAPCKMPDNQQPADCCPEGVKEKIEHGPVKVGGCSDGEECCNFSEKEYKGLDEFRCPGSRLTFQQCSGIPGLVEKQVQYNKKTITIIDPAKWNKLNLLQQLTYLKEKIEEIKQKIQNDKNQLSEGKIALSKCYLAVSYVDLVKVSQSTNENQTIILPRTQFFDSETNQPMDATKYCQGFNYSNSSCFEKCNNECPDASQQAMECYQKCGSCNSGDSVCANKQEICVEKCYTNRPCTLSSNNNQNWGQCITSCRNDCSNACSAKYLACSDEYKICKDQCDDNSKCLINNAGNCLFGAEEFQRCASQVTDPGNSQYCINKSYLCKNGSNQYAGYEDCTGAKRASYDSKDDCTTNKDCTTSPGETCDPTTGTCMVANSDCVTDKYSSAYFYDHPECLKCSNPYNPPNSKSVCYNKTNTSASCQELCPEVTKCPASSKCASCSCNEVDKTLKFSIPNLRGSEEFAIDGPKSSTNIEISNHQIVGPECSQYGNNDDPLTFYCEDKWFSNPNREGKSPTPIGAQRVCPESGEVPIGQTIYEAENWADKIMETATNESQDIQKLLDQMKKVGDAINTPPIQNYCKCNAKLEDGNAICVTGCSYSQWYENIVDDEEQEFLMLMCNCSFVPCKGKPCQQVTEYLAEIWDLYGKLKTNFVDFYVTMLREPRSDIIKKLTYSRKKTNDCSLVANNYGSKERLLSCTRVEDELIPPINNGKIMFDNKNFDSYCFGADLGKLLNKNLSDNWFCCQEYQKNPSSTNQPK